MARFMLSAPSMKAGPSYKLRHCIALRVLIAILVLSVAGPVAAQDAASLELRFAGPRQSRTVLEGVVAVPARLLTRNAYGFFNLLLSGEVRSAGHAYDTFRYRYDVAVDADAAKPLAVSFERALRPGSFELVLAVEDLQSGWRYELHRPLEVPRLGTPPVAAAAPALLPPVEAPGLELERPRQPILTGKQRFDAVARGELARVRFLLDGRPILAKKSPPWSVELDLGRDPRVVKLAAEGYDAAGELVAGDELVLNAAGDGLAVRLVEPLAGRSYTGEATARARVEVPPGHVVAAVEFWLDDALVASDATAPYSARLALAGEQQVVRAVARLGDGTTAEDVRLVNGRGHLQELEVDYVELYTAALAGERPVHDLATTDFRVFENGVAQTLARVERAANLPARLALVLDVSGSMRDRLAQVTQAAARFLDEVLAPQDEATVLTFNGRPRVVVDFTGDSARLGNGLVGLATSGTTRLLDSLAFALEQLAGGTMHGQRAVLLLSDGKDVGSVMRRHEVIELARRLGVTVYVVAFDVRDDDLEARTLLSALADETGGRAHYLAGTGGLDQAYASIARDLRSRYLLAYQSSHSGSAFRVVDVKVARGGVSARTIRGYYP